MTKRYALILVLGVSLLSWAGTASAAQSKTKAKTARGTVTAVSNDSLTVSVKASSMTFGIDPNTLVVAHGARNKGNQAKATGQSGPKLADVVRSGQSVVVTYQETGGAMHATRVQVTAEPRTGTK